ncbi:MAG TPA: metallophosphoesterase family protein [Polyangiaceae bacterium]|nr:metallophosphoesterase family protein [Polyangiaceae bacterium]
MAIGVVSDIHGNLFALRAVVDDMVRRGVSRVINLGDNLSGPLLPRETGEYLRAQAWLHLAGNHERQILESRPTAVYNSDAYAHERLTPELLSWLRELRPVVELDADLLCCHGTPRSDSEYLLETVTPEGIRLATTDEIEERLEGNRHALVLCGHSHVPRAVRHGGSLLVNPGSVGLQAYFAKGPPSYIVETGSTDARYAIVERLETGWRAELISVPYDYSAAVALAAHVSREWAHALGTGRAFTG